MATRASFVCRSLAGERVIPARGFFLDTFPTAIEPTEVLTEVRIPRRGPQLGRRLRRSSSGGSATSRRSASRPSLRSTATGGSGRPGSASPPWRRRPFAATDAEAVLVGPGARRGRRSAPPVPPLRRRAGPSATATGPPTYKRAMVAEMTVRALRVAVDRATRVRIGVER